VSNAAESTALTVDEADPGRFFWYGVYLVIMGVSVLPLFGARLPQLFPYVPTLVVHEFAAFLFFGHTFFSNIWSMRLRQTQPTETGIWARAMLRKLALIVTGPTSVIIPLAGLMLVESWGGLQGAPWAWDAYFAFWLMAAVSIVPDVIRYGRNRNAANPKHGMKSGAIRGMTALVLTLYIMFVMVTKSYFFAGLFLADW
jgi:hypothetical protein